MSMLAVPRFSQLRCSVNCSNCFHSCKVPAINAKKAPEFSQIFIYVLCSKCWRSGIIANTSNYDSLLLITKDHMLSFFRTWCNRHFSTSTRNERYFDGPIKNCKPQRATQFRNTSRILNGIFFFQKAQVSNINGKPRPPKSYDSWNPRSVEWEQLDRSHPGHLP